jgi:hypothetical protein
MMITKKTFELFLPTFACLFCLTIDGCFPEKQAIASEIRYRATGKEPDVLNH